MTCNDCLNGVHDICSTACDCACNPIREDYPSFTFPSTTPEEISLILKALGEHGRAKAPNLPETITELKEIDDPLLRFLTLVAENSHKSKEFNEFMYACKQMLHLINRSSGLTNAYLAGVGIGYFLARPEMLPVREGDKEDDYTGSIS